MGAGELGAEKGPHLAEAYPYTLRWDWADEMLYWFDWYLRDEGRAPTLGVEMQDNQGGRGGRELGLIQ